MSYAATKTMEPQQSPQRSTNMDNLRVDGPYLWGRKSVPEAIYHFNVQRQMLELNFMLTVVTLSQKECLSQKVNRFVCGFLPPNNRTFNPVLLRCEFKTRVDERAGIYLYICQTESELHLFGEQERDKHRKVSVLMLVTYT